MNYIKLENAVSLIEKLPIDNTTPEWAIQKACLIERLNSLPSISFEWLIQETIKEYDFVKIIDYELSKIDIEYSCKEEFEKYTEAIQILRKIKEKLLTK